MNKLYRSTRNRMLTGLIGGISENLGLSTTFATDHFLHQYLRNGWYISIHLLHRSIGCT